MQTSTDQRDMLTKWASRHFRSLKTYFEDDDSRQDGLACIFVRLAIQTLLQTPSLIQCTRVILTELRDSITTTQHCMFRLDHSDIPDKEFRLMQLYPAVWLLNVFSEAGNSEIFQIFRLNSTSIQEESDNHKNANNRKMLNMWASRHFRRLKTYFDNDNSRQEGLCCTFVRIAIQNLLSTPSLRHSIRDALTELRDSFATTQLNIYRLDHSDIKEDEYKMMHVYPSVWLMNVFSKSGNQEVMDIFQLTSPPPHDETDAITQLSMNF